MTWLIKQRLFEHLRRMEHDKDVALVLATTFGTVKPGDATILKLARAIRGGYTEKRDPESMVQVEI